MLVPGDLGFPGFIWVFFFFFVSTTGLVIRRKWRIATERKMEILRLVAMASEEAERAEIEAAYEYGTTVSVARQYQCALCFCPTTTRCSRCKAVRYCSGKCQIIHWRRGHKDECYPASTSIEFNDPGSDSGRKTVYEGENNESFDNDLNMGSKWDAKALETTREEPASFESNQLPEFLRHDDDKIVCLADGEGEDIIAEPSGKLVGFTKSSSTNSLMDVSVSESPVSGSPARSEGISSDTGFGEFEKKVEINEAELTRSTPSKLNSLDASRNSSSHSNKSKQKTPTCNPGAVEHGSTRSSGSSFHRSEVSSTSEPSKAQSDFSKETLDCNESVTNVQDDSAQSTCTISDNDISSDSRNLLQFSFKLSQHAIPNSHSKCSELKTLTTNVAHQVTTGNKMHANGGSLSEKSVKSVVRDTPILSSESPASGNSTKDSNSEQLKRRGIRSLSSSDSDGRSSFAAGKHSISNGKVHSSAAGENSISNAKVSEADSAQVVATRYEIAHSSQNASNGLKTSVQKVVQQFKGPKLSKHNGLGSDAAKQSYKMLFPYELFVKLYNKDKAELHPCGLTNCGNSCYANAVLQCLAFTRPLTAYLLQGIHSKECSKKDWCFTCEFENLIKKAKEGKSPLSPIGILSQLHNIGSHLGHGKEEDAHEFLRYAIDKMQSVCLKEAGINAVGPLAEETTLIGLIFGGYLRSKIKCMRCQGKSERHERMMDLTVEIQGDIGTLEEATEFPPDKNPKLMADYRHIRRGYMPHDAVETHTNGWSKPGFSEGYEDHVFKRSVVVCNPNEGCVITTETVVEEVSLPVLTLHGNSYPVYPAMEAPMKSHGVGNYGGGFPVMGEPRKVYMAPDHEGSPPAKEGSVKVYGVTDNRGTKPGSPPHHRYPKTDNFISDIHTDAGHPSKTSSMSIMNWSQRPNGHGGGIDNGRDGYGTNIYGVHNETAANGFHPHFDVYHGRNEMETDTKHKIPEGGFTKPTNHRGTAVDNWTEARKSPPVITAPIRYATEKPTHGQPKEIFPSTIDSREAARRYGGSSISPKAIKEVETYTPIIDSYEAAQRYKGQLL